MLTWIEVTCVCYAKHEQKVHLAENSYINNIHSVQNIMLNWIEFKFFKQSTTTFQMSCGLKNYCITIGTPLPQSSVNLRIKMA